MSSFIRGDAGQSAGGEYTFAPTATTDAVEVAIPDKCRYYKISASTTLKCRLRNDATSQSIWAQQGTNIENIGWLLNTNAISALILTFHG